MPVCPIFRGWRNSWKVWPGLFGISHDRQMIRKARFLVGQWRNPLCASKHFQKSGVRLIHWTDINHLAAPLWRRLLDRSGMKMVISAHDVKRGVAVLNRGYEDRQLTGLYRRADAILVHSEFQKTELVEFAEVEPAKVTVVPHGPYSERRAPKEPGRNPGALRCSEGVYFGIVLWAVAG